MTHEDAGKYRAKHPAATTYDPIIAAALRTKVQDGRIGCAVAHALAAEFAVTPAEIGKTADLLEYRISRCQLGLFGYSPEKKIVKAAESVPDGLAGLLRQSAVDEKIGCASCWKIADDNKLERMAVAAACERLGLKITHCQLGAF